SVDVPVGGSLTFTVGATVAGSATGTVTNTAIVTPPAGTTDPTPGNNAPSDTDTVTPASDLSVTENDGTTSVAAGGSATYTLVVGNAGPSPAVGALLRDPAAPNLTLTSVVCTFALNGAACPPGPLTVADLQGAGITVNVPVGGFMVFNVTATVAGSAVG